MDGRDHTKQELRHGAIILAKKGNAANHYDGPLHTGCAGLTRERTTHTYALK